MELNCVGADAGCLGGYGGCGAGTLRICARQIRHEAEEKDAPDCGFHKTITLSDVDVLNTVETLPQRFAGPKCCRDVVAAHY